MAFFTALATLPQLLAPGQGARSSGQRVHFGVATATGSRTGLPTRGALAKTAVGRLGRLFGLRGTSVTNQRTTVRQTWTTVLDSLSVRRRGLRAAAAPPPSAHLGSRPAAPPADLLALSTY